MRITANTRAGLTLIELLAGLIALFIFISGIIWIYIRVTRALSKMVNPTTQALTNELMQARSQMIAEINEQHGTNWTLLADTTTLVTSNTMGITFYHRVDWSTNLRDWLPVSDEPITDEVWWPAPNVDNRPMQFYRHIIHD